MAMHSLQVGFLLVPITVMAGLFFGAQLGLGREYTTDSKVLRTNITAVFAENTTVSNSPASPAIIVDSKVLYTTAHSGRFLNGTLGVGFAEQADNCLTNLKNIVQAAGYENNNVVKINIFLTDIKELPAFNVVFQKYFKKPYPTRTTIQAILEEGILVKADVIAHCDKPITNREYSEEEEDDY